jgi:NADH-quinone oxidoreductase subunit E
MQARVRRSLKRLPERFGRSRNLLIPILQHVQGELGYLPRQAMAGIADYLHMPASEVYGVATFYAQFRFTPVGKNRIVVCRGTACHVRGSAGILKELQREIGIEPFETSPDMLFTLETVACLGSCALAPVLVVNSKVHGRQKAAVMGGLVTGLKKGSAGKSGGGTGKKKKAGRRRGARSGRGGGR